MRLQALCFASRNGPIPTDSGKKAIHHIEYNPRLRFFLDGSLRTKYLGEYIEGERCFPILATEVSCAVVQRVEYSLKPGRKNINNTLTYMQLVNLADDEYVSKVAKTMDEACQLVEAGSEYVTELDGAKIFRKRK